MVAGWRGAFFLVAVCGDEGEEGMSELVGEPRFLEDRGVMLSGAYD